MDDQDGSIGADVFGAYLVDLDLPGMRLKLSPLPMRPEDTVAPKSLRSEGEEQANAEQKEGIVAEHAAKESKSSALTPAQHLPRDRYVASEMANWTKVFRFGHLLLVPTSVNFSEPVLFVVDTGADSNILSSRAERHINMVSSGGPMRIRGLNGAVNKSYLAKATLGFGHLRQPNLDMVDIVTLDLSKTSRQAGTEVSGFLGFGMLRRLELKLDYRDGLVDFEYDPNGPSTMNEGAAKLGFGFTGSGGDFGSQFASYVEGVQRKLIEKWPPDFSESLKKVDPRITAARRIYLKFDIARDGHLSNVEIEQSSGVPSLDISAIRALQRIGTVGPLPSNYSGSKVSVEFWFDLSQ